MTPGRASSVDQMRILRLRVHQPFHLDEKVSHSFGGNPGDRALLFQPIRVLSNTLDRGQVVLERKIDFKRDKQTVVEHMYELEGRGDRMVCFLSDLQLSYRGDRVNAAMLRIVDGFDLCLVILKTTAAAVGSDRVKKKNWSKTEQTLCLLNKMLSVCHNLLQCDVDVGHPIFHSLCSGKEHNERLGLLAIREQLGNGVLTHAAALNELDAFLISALAALEEARKTDNSHPCVEHFNAVANSIKHLQTSAKAHRELIVEEVSDDFDGEDDNEVEVEDDPIPGPSGLGNHQASQVESSDDASSSAKDGPTSTSPHKTSPNHAAKPKGCSRHRSDASKVDPRGQAEYRNLREHAMAVPGMSPQKADEIALANVGRNPRHIELIFDELWNLHCGGGAEPQGLESSNQEQQEMEDQDASIDSSGLAPPSEGEGESDRAPTPMRSVSSPAPSSSSSAANTHQSRGFKIHRRVPSRYYQHFDPINQYVRVAEGAFLRMVGGQSGINSVPGMMDPTKAITHIDYVENKKLENKFKRAKQRLKLNGKDDRELLLFHNSAVSDLDSVLRDNFNPDGQGETGAEVLRVPEGPGVHFSEYPSVALGFGSGLILCRVLPGLVQTIGHSLDSSRFDSLRYDGHRGNQDEDNVASWDDPAQTIVINDNRLILPFCVIRLNRDMAGESVSKMVEMIRRRLEIKPELPPPSQQEQKERDPEPSTSSGPRRSARRRRDEEIKVVKKTINSNSKTAESPPKRQRRAQMLEQRQERRQRESVAATLDPQQVIQTLAGSLENFPEVNYRMITYRIPRHVGSSSAVHTFFLPDTFLGNQVLRYLRLLHERGLLFSSNATGSSVSLSVASVGELAQRRRLNTKILRRIARDLKKFLAQKGISD